MFYLILDSHPSPPAHRSRPVCLEGFKQSRRRQGAGHTEGSGGVHVAQAGSVPSGMQTQEDAAADRLPLLQTNSSSRAAAHVCPSCVVGVGDVHPRAAAVSQRERGQVEEAVEANR